MPYKDTFYGQYLECRNIFQGYFVILSWMPVYFKTVSLCSASVFFEYIN